MRETSVVLAGPVTCLKLPITCLKVPIACVKLPITCLKLRFTWVRLPITCLKLPITCLNLTGDLQQIMNRELLSSMAMTARQRLMRLYTHHSRRRGKPCRLSRSLYRAAARDCKKSERPCDSIRQQVCSCQRCPSNCYFDSHFFLLHPAGQTSIVCAPTHSAAVWLTCTPC